MNRGRGLRLQGLGFRVLGFSGLGFRIYVLELFKRYARMWIVFAKSIGYRLKSVEG